jgi:transcriptional regulator with XRE-family HTH domain
MTTHKPTHPLKAWRLKQEPKLTLSALAGVVGVSASHLSEIENWNNEPSLELLDKLCAKAKLTVADFVKPKESATC